MSSPLDELRRLGEELREVFTEERRAIATLDHARLELVAVRKQALARDLAELRPKITTHDAIVRDLFEAIRIEAQATAMLAAAATEAVRAVLGYDTRSNGYDRHARPITTGPTRTLAAY